MTLRLAVAPADEPISLADAKLHLKLDDSTDDVLVQAFIQAARQGAEHELGRSLMPQTWELLLDAFPGGAIELAKLPIQSITSVTYADTAGITQTLPADQYALDADNGTGWLLPAYGETWPDTLDAANAVTVRFVTGYANAAAVPGAVRSWMLLRIGALYRNREAFAMGSMTELPGCFVDRLLDPYRVYG